MTDPTYVCTDCETELAEFPIECPECGGSEFERVTDDEESDEDEETLMDEMAKLSRPLNPVAPA
jgi:predicted  nucleic acid-binding Zn-ribbon protein